jgi:indole-3-glycerol phosphate synthase
MEVELILTSTIPDILSRIVERKRVELGELESRRRQLEPLAEESVRRRRPFAGALKFNRPAIIAEIKQASPSKGIFTANYQPDRIAVSYEQGGAAAISVLTDQDFFHGSLSHLEEARAAVSLPALRKDFTISEAQIVEAAANGADAILLIAAILTAEELRRFREFAAQFLMAALVEVHDADELEKAIDSGAAIIGVNNRDLRTFEVRLQTSLDLAPRIPPGAIRVSESGITTRQHIHELSAAGYHAFLVGEHLMRSQDPAAAIRELTCS